MGEELDKGKKKGKKQGREETESPETGKGRKELCITTQDPSGSADSDTKQPFGFE